MAQSIYIYVYMDDERNNSPILMGVLHREILRGKEVFSFENNPEWIKHEEFRALDPDLLHFSGKQYLPADKSNFGIFLDAMRGINVKRNFQLLYCTSLLDMAFYLNADDRPYFTTQHR